VPSPSHRVPLFRPLLPSLCVYVSSIRRLLRASCYVPRRPFFSAFSTFSEFFISSQPPTEQADFPKGMNLCDRSQDPFSSALSPGVPCMLLPFLPATECQRDADDPPLLSQVFPFSLIFRTSAPLSVFVERGEPSWSDRDNL